MSERLSRRTFLAGLGLAAAAKARAQTPGSIRLGYAAITWGGNDEQAIREIADVGFRGIQLRTSAFDRFSSRPAALRELLTQHHRLTLAAFSSGNLGIDPALERDQIALHLRHAEFVRSVGGSFLQIIDERPKGRPIAAADYTRLGRLLSDLARRTADIGIPLVYHHHMNSLGEKPVEIDAILDAADAHVGVLFDIAHYAQGGGDPVGAIRKYGRRIRVVHLKDVRPMDAAPGYQWVELGRGRVDVKACVAALREIGFEGWAIIELDRVPDANGSPKASAIANRTYAEWQLGLTL